MLSRVKTPEDLQRVRGECDCGERHRHAEETVRVGRRSEHRSAAAMSALLRSSLSCVVGAAAAAVADPQAALTVHLKPDPVVAGERKHRPASASGRRHLKGGTIICSSAAAPTQVRPVRMVLANPGEADRT